MIPSDFSAQSQKQSLNLQINIQSIIIIKYYQAHHLMVVAEYHELTCAFTWVMFLEAGD